MRKLKSKVIENLIAARPTSTEVDFIVWLSRYQNDAGMVRGVYYKSVCKDLQISPQSFYNVIRRLEEKEVIKGSKVNSYFGYWDIQIMGNDFSKASLRPGMAAVNYLDMGKDVFYDPDFFAMKANEKLMTMLYMIYGSAGSGRYHIGTQLFFEKYTGLFQVKKRALQNYLKRIRKFFSIGVKDRQYWIRPLRKSQGKESGHTDRSERAKQIAGSLCRRFRLESPGQALSDIRELVEQYTYNTTTDLEPVFMESIKDLLSRRNGSKEPFRWKWREINKKFLHRIFLEHLPKEALL